jgi:hypothetical protein
LSILAVLFAGEVLLGNSSFVELLLLFEVFVGGVLGEVANRVPKRSIRL